jgi:hypothetical protein
MSGVETISDESEVGFNQAFASNRFRAEQAGRVAKVRSTPAPGPGPRDGPFSHELGQSPDRARAVYDGPIAHHGSGTTLLVHIRRRQDRGMDGAFSGICTIGLMHFVESWLKTRSNWFGGIINGTVMVVFEDSEFSRGQRSRRRIAERDVIAAARKLGPMCVTQVRYPVAERGGKISFVQDEA